MSMAAVGSVGSVDVDQLASVHSENESLQSIDSSENFESSFIFPLDDIEIPGPHAEENDAETHRIDSVRNSRGDLGSEGVTMNRTETSASPSNFGLSVNRMGQQLEFSPIVGTGRFETTSAPPAPLYTPAEEDLEEYENETRLLLEDYKCPICLDTLINTVKVDCISGHKFCNYCIKCWTRYERQVVTECPVCRGSILQRTSDTETDEVVDSIFELFSERTKLIRLRAIRERVQLEETQSSSYRLPSYYPMDFGRSSPVRVARDGIIHHHRNLTSLLPLLRSTLLGNHRACEANERRGYYDLAFAFGNHPGSFVGAAGGRDRHEQQQDQSEAGELIHGGNWSNGAPTGNLNNATSIASSPGIFNRNSGAEGNDIRYQHHQYQNLEQPYNSWNNNNPYLSPDEIRSWSTPYINTNSGAVWSGYNYQAATTPRSVNAGANSQSSSVMGLEAQGNSNNLLDSGTVNSHGHPCHHNHQGPVTYCSAVPPPTGSTTTVPNPSYGHFPSPFSPPSSSSTCSIAIQSAPNYHPSYGSSGFSNYSSTAGQIHCHITGPQMPSPPPPPFRSRVSLTSTTCLGSNVCCNNFMQTPQTGYSMSATGPIMPPTSPPSTPPCISPRSTGHNTAGEWEYPPGSPRSQMANEGVGRNQQRTCYNHCQQENYANVRSTSDSRGPPGLFLPSGGTASGNMCQGHNARCPSFQTQTQVSTCPILSNGSFFAGGFPLYSPRSGFIGFQISHHNHPTAIVTDHRQIIPPVAPGRITHPIVSLVPLNPDGSSTQVSLTFEVHSPQYLQPHGP